jgi:quinohemoprotein ethanol dehydrogenase
MTALRPLFLGIPLLLPLAGAAQSPMTDARILEESATGEHWFLKGGDFTGAHYTPLDQVNEDSVGELGLAWATDLPIPDGTATTPIVVDGVIYVGGAYSRVVALDAASGRIRWSYESDVRDAFDEYPWLSWISRANRGVAVWGDSVFVTTADCRLTSLDADNGEPRWTRQVCDVEQGYSISDSPYVGGGKVFVGNAGSESDENNRGYVSAFDAQTGKPLWRFYIVPSHIPEENDTPALRMAAKTWSGDTLATIGGGGNSWNEMTYDPASNQLFFGTSGTAIYDYPTRSPGGGDNLFLSSIIAVDADTGEYNWHYQTVDQDSWDFNATMNIVVADLHIDDEQRETVLIAPKNGFHYTLDRHTGELLAADKYAKVNWATGINLETGRPDYDPAAQYWNADDGEQVYFWPNFWGAHSWNPMAFHPDLGLSYIPAIDLPTEIDNQGNSEDVVMVTEIDGKPHAPGKLVAVDATTGSIRWSIDHVLPYNGGVLATGGNLVFQGTAEGEFAAYSADRGARLWSVQTGSAINAAPASYAVEGRQHIVVPIGTAGGLQYRYPEMHAAERVRGPVRLLAFTIGGDAEPPRNARAELSLPEQPPLDATAAEIERGEALYAIACQACHGVKAVARVGGSVPDLRYASMAAHGEWERIVVDGDRAGKGMPDFDLSREEARDIQRYVLSLSEALRRGE